MKNPKLPKKIRVLTRMYTVRTNNKISEYGRVDRHTCVIEINRQKCERPEVVMQTFWHEVGHAWVWEAGICNFLNGQAEEMAVESFAALVIDLTGGKITQRR